MELSTMTESNVYDKNYRLLSTSISSSGHDSVIGNLLIKVSGLKEAATRELENKLGEHSTENTMIELTTCPSPGAHNNQDSPLDFSVKRRTSFSGSLTDDSQTSSSSPGHTTDCSMRSPSSDPMPVDHISSISRWRTPSSDGLGDQISFEQTKAVASPVSLHGFLGNFGLFPGTLENHLTHDSEMNTFSQLAGVMFNDKCHKKNSILLKQYQNEALQMPLGFLGIAGPALAAVQNSLDVSSLMGVTNRNILHMYKQQLELAKTAEISARFSTKSSISLSPYSGKQQQEKQRNHHYTRIPAAVTNSRTSPHLNRISSVTLHARDSPELLDTSQTSRTPALSHSNPRKRASSFPDDQKDEAYWERRRKNNDAAKRSRDARRAKEEEIAIRASFLEQQNLKLREEVALLRTETHRLRHMLYSS